MAVYSDIFIATDADLLAAPLDQHEPTDYFPTVEGKSITPLSLATLEAILTGDRDPYAGLDERMDTWDQNEVWTRLDGNISVERFSDTLVSALATLTPETMEQAARAWEDTDEVRASRDRAEHVAWLASYLERLSHLAIRARVEGRGMYLWAAV